MKKFFIIVCLILCSVFVADAAEKKDLVLYLETTGSNIVLKWDDTNDQLAEYEVRLYSFERKVFVAIGKTTNDTITFQVAKSGHYTAQIQACLIDQSTCTECCTVWYESSDPEIATVDGSARGWWIYGYLDAPGPIIIE